MTAEGWYEVGDVVEVPAWWDGYRKRVKEKAVQYKGGKCAACGYNRCNRSMDFHHVEPDNKDFIIAKGIIS